MWAPKQDKRLLVDRLCENTIKTIKERDVFITSFTESVKLDVITRVSDFSKQNCGKVMKMNFSDECDLRGLCGMFETFKAVKGSDLKEPLTKEESSTILDYISEFLKMQGLVTRVNQDTECLVISWSK